MARYNEMNTSKYYANDHLSCNYELAKAQVTRAVVDSELKKETEYLHKLGREHYDTPASIKLCCCAECNSARRIYGKKPKRWNVELIRAKLVHERMTRLDELAAPF